jgi:hypothetical protein
MIAFAEPQVYRIGANTVFVSTSDGMTGEEGVISVQVLPVQLPGVGEPQGVISVLNAMNEACEEEELAEIYSEPWRSGARDSWVPKSTNCSLTTESRTLAPSAAL